MITKDIKTILKTIIDIIKPNKYNPMSNLVEIETQKEGYSFFCTNGETKVQIIYLYQDSHFSKSVVDIKDLYDIIKGMKEEKFSFETQKNNLCIVYGDTQYAVKTQTDVDNSELCLFTPFSPCVSATLLDANYMKELYKVHSIALKEDKFYYYGTLYHKNKGYTYTTDNHTLCLSDYVLPQNYILPPNVIYSINCLPVDEYVDCSGYDSYVIRARNKKMKFFIEIQKQEIKEEIPEEKIKETIDKDMPSVLGHINKKDFLATLTRLKAVLKNKDKKAVSIQADVITDVYGTAKETIKGEHSGDSSIVHLDIDKLIKIVKNMDKTFCIRTDGILAKIYDEHVIYFLACIKIHKYNKE